METNATLSMSPIQREIGIYKEGQFYVEPDKKQMAHGLFIQKLLDDAVNHERVTLKRGISSTQIMSLSTLRRYVL